MYFQVFLPLTNNNIEDDAGCQQLTSTLVKKRASGPAGKHSLKANSKSSNEPNRKSSKEASKIS